MIDKAHLQQLARYNRWQNENLYGAAESLSDEERKRERGAFFGSIHGTFNHLVWADRQWFARFTGGPRSSIGIQESVGLYPDWDELKRERIKLDRTIADWADALNPSWLEGELRYFSGSVQRELSLPKQLVVTHFFNHQTHHRGQIHCMLTQAGAKPGVTDLVFMP
jgi:uncharacterized damage-inducible protein DinB